MYGQDQKRFVVSPSNVQKMSRRPKLKRIREKIEPKTGQTSKPGKKTTNVVTSTQIGKKGVHNASNQGTTREDVLFRYACHGQLVIYVLCLAWVILNYYDYVGWCYLITSSIK